MSFDQDWLTLRWRVDGSGNLMLPPFAGKTRRDELWSTTCFELFLRTEGEETYTEFNFSPSDAWAAYDFTARRQRMRPRALSRPPVCTMRPGRTFALFDVAVPASALPAIPAALGLTAVLEETGGNKSFWAMDHGAADSGKRPDFHDPSCLAARLAATGAS
ncbi:DOMON-like domain-containing protein [Alteripontixanthobacter maritimus]|uniref:DOMON-like domain-containing protein n=1 Tax=Alteripontixanthobacter maritimus TaxID=2161824 RepID=UPI001E46368C|nr:DOMON-like domain-containing protein [Alteripontixanthobacter maritimus]